MPKYEEKHVSLVYRLLKESEDKPVASKIVEEVLSKGMSYSMLRKHAKSDEDRRIADKIYSKLLDAYSQLKAMVEMKSPKVASAMPEDRGFLEQLADKILREHLMS